MKFGPLPVGEAVGALAAHGLRAGTVSLKKGRTISAEMAEALKVNGIETVVAVRLDPDDVGEDEAAQAMADAVAGSGLRVERPFTGRSNLFAIEAGVLLVDTPRVDAINAVDEAVTLATLPAFRPVVAGEMVATVKIIPYGVPRPALEAALTAARDGPAVSLAAYRIRKVGVVSTLTPALKRSVVDKTTAAFRDRLRPAAAEIVAEGVCDHDADALTAELVRQAGAEPELVVVFGASAIADRRDVIPAAIEAAGGRIEHFGMPVDPGNLLLVGSIGAVPVLGAPGCARSPKENGFDWVLQRLLAGLAVSRADITRLGVGGLLMEIISRGQPREGGEPRSDE